MVVYKLSEAAERAIRSRLYDCLRTRLGIKDMLAENDDDEIRFWAGKKDRNLERIERFILHVLPLAPSDPYQRVSYLNDCMKSIECLADVP